MSTVEDKRKRAAKWISKRIQFEPTQDPAWGKCTMFMEQALVNAENLRWYLLKTSASFIERKPPISEFLSDMTLIKEHWHNNFNSVFDRFVRSPYVGNLIREFFFSIKLRHKEWVWYRGLQKSNRSFYIRLCVEATKAKWRKFWFNK